MKPSYSVAIDGPAGSGKSTISKLVARRFGLSYVDTGAMYRGVGLLALRNGIDSKDEEKLAAIAAEAEFDFRMDPDSTELLNRVFLNGEEVTDAIREHEVSDMASKVSALSGVRKELVAKQKKMGREGGVVMEGRDICNVVLPGAEVKLFMDASAEERAKRRHGDLKRAGKEMPYEDVLKDIKERDHRDSTRSDSPLGQAPDAALVDTDGKTIEQVVDSIAEIIKDKTGAG